MLPADSFVMIEKYNIAPCSTHFYNNYNLTPNETNSLLYIIIRVAGGGQRGRGLIVYNNLVRVNEISRQYKFRD